jgi:hypothetical protein
MYKMPHFCTLNNHVVTMKDDYKLHPVFIGVFPCTSSYVQYKKQHFIRPAKSFPLISDLKFSQW